MSSQWFTIGEFSKASGLSVKTLRFYHEKGILAPASIDDASGYRYYDEASLDRARIIRRLREVGFSIEEIAEILGQCEDDADIIGHLDRQKKAVAERIRSEKDVIRKLDEIIRQEIEAKKLLEAGSFAVEEKTLDPILIAGFRLRGKYSDCGKGFSRIGRALGRHICGKPFCLYYDCEYREDDADLESCFPVRKQVAAEGISVRTLAGCRSLSLVHKGPYEQLGLSYEKVLREAKGRKAAISLPTREVYLKGPGMIFKGNPKNYLTEIQLPLGTA